jgi:hypothetical protein
MGETMHDALSSNKKYLPQMEKNYFKITKVVNTNEPCFEGVASVITNFFRAKSRPN